MFSRQYVQEVEENFVNHITDKQEEIPRKATEAEFGRLLTRAQKEEMQTLIQSFPESTGKCEVELIELHTTFRRRPRQLYHRGHIGYCLL